MFRGLHTWYILILSGSGTYQFVMPWLIVYFYFSIVLRVA